jgi:hypothetical protein
MKTIKDFLTSERDLTNYLDENFVDWYLVSDEDKDMLVDWALNGADACERWEDITMNHADTSELGELLVAVSRSDLNAAVALGEYTRKMALSYVMELCDRQEQAELIKEALSSYNRQYATNEQVMHRIREDMLALEHLR